MEDKDFVPFETAKKLKEAGFDWECDSVYHISLFAGREIELWHNRALNDWNKSARAARFISAPTLWQAQKWLREKRNIHINIEAVFGKRWTYTLVDTAPQTDMYGHIQYQTLGRNSYPDSDAYETVLSAAIDAALLITNKTNFEPLNPRLLCRLHQLLAQKTQEKIILDLILKHDYYDMIDAGEKTEEYRDPFVWAHRFLDVDRGNGFIKVKRDYFEYFYQRTCDQDKDFVGQLKYELKQRNFAFRNYYAVRFHRGYTNTTMLFKNEGITIGKGNPAWGAPTDREVFIIKLGERITN